MIIIKIIRFLGKIITTIVKVFFVFFKLFFKILFYDLLVSIYFKIFRFKKNELAGMTLKNLLSKEATSFVILLFTLILMVINFIPSRGIKTASAKLSKTVASNLILSDFDTNIEESFIEERLNKAILSSVKNRSLKEKDFIEKTTVIKSDETERIIPVISLNENSDTILKPSFLFENITSTPKTEQRREITEYTVQLGDTISSIANRFGLTVNTILWANNLSINSLIRPGNTLNIPPVSGLVYSVKSGDNLSKIATTYKIEVSEIIKQNDLKENESLKIGQKLILPGAARIVPVSRPTPPRTPSTTTPSSNVSKLPPTQSTSGSMAWPAEGRRITQYFSWAHNGLDIANKSGTAIYAAEAGTVEIAATGWNGGYGNTILINHGNGKKTRYGHLTTLYVKVGDRVEKGENIGTMGSTGRSTGPHLHFEVVINGTRYNPLNYIK